MKAVREHIPHIIAFSIGFFGIGGAMVAPVLFLAY